MRNFVHEALWNAGATIAGGVSLALMGVVCPLSGQAPSLPSPWRFSAEAGATGGSVWLQGPQVPRVSTGVGFMFAATAGRALSDATSAGAALRVNVQPVDLRENGVKWKGGTLTEYDLLALLSVRIPSPASMRASVEGGIGAAVLTGADPVVPFRGAPGVVPMGEVGLAMMLGRVSSWRQDVSLVARYGVLRLSAEDANGGTTGWVGRVSAGARITR